MKRWWSRVPGRLFLLTMLLGSVLITFSSLAYFQPGFLAPFVVEKLPVRFEALWLFSLKIHVASAIVSLPCCLLLLTRPLQRRAAVHRWLGRFASMCMLGALVPSGVVLAFEAKGGWPVTLGFLLSAAITAVALVAGIHFARRRKLSSHARAMRHVVAQMSVAVTSRAMLFGFDFLLVDPSTAYVLALWIPVVVSAVAAEGISGQLPFSNLRFNPLSPWSQT